MKLTESQKILKNINEGVSLKESIRWSNHSMSDEDDGWIVAQVEDNMNKVFDEIDKKFGTEMGYDSDFCTGLCEDIEERLEEWLEENSESEDESYEEDEEEEDEE